MLYLTKNFRSRNKRDRIVIRRLDGMRYKQYVQDHKCPAGDALREMLSGGLRRYPGVSQKKRKQLTLFEKGRGYLP